VLLRIFNECARLTLEFGHVKKELGLPVFDRPGKCILSKRMAFIGSESRYGMPPSGIPPFSPRNSRFFAWGLQSGRIQLLICY